MRKLLHKRTLNELLIVHLTLSTPWIVLALWLHGVFAIIAFLWLSLGWATLRHLNRLAWKRHFRPRQPAETPRG